MKTRLLRAASLLFLFPFLSGCADKVRLYTQPPGGDVTLDGKPLGSIPAEGKEVEVTWWTFKRNEVEVRWPGGPVLRTELKKGMGQPKHTDYLILDGVGLLLFIVPGVVAFCFNGMGPEAEQHLAQGK